MAHVKLSNDIHEILTRCTVTESSVALPPGQLERAVYVKVKKALEAVGGKWNTGKQAFLFSKDPRPELGIALDTGTVVDKKKVRQAFYTPKDIADEIAHCANVTGRYVLEPSAGDGALAEACYRAGALTVNCVEKEEGCREALEAVNRTPRGHGIVMIEDFLTIPQVRSYSRVVMNPPFNRREFVKHIRHAEGFLSSQGRLYAVTPDVDVPELERLGATTVKTFAAGAFKESGTNIATRLIEIIRH